MRELNSDKTEITGSEWPIGTEENLSLDHTQSLIK